MLFRLIRPKSYSQPQHYHRNQLCLCLIENIHYNNNIIWLNCLLRKHVLCQNSIDWSISWNLSRLFLASQLTKVVESARLVCVAAGGSTRVLPPPVVRPGPDYFFFFLIFTRLKKHICSKNDPLTLKKIRSKP